MAGSRTGRPAPVRFRTARAGSDPEAGLGHDYEGREAQPGTPEHDKTLAEYLEWTNSPYVEVELELELDR